VLRGALQRQLHRIAEVIAGLHNDDMDDDEISSQLVGSQPLPTLAPQERAGVLLAAYVNGLESHFTNITDIFVTFSDALGSVRDDVHHAYSSHVSVLTTTLSEVASAANALFARASASNDFTSATNGLSKLAESWTTLANSVQSLSELSENIRTSREDTVTIRTLMQRLRTIQRQTANLARVSSAVRSLESSLTTPIQQQQQQQYVQ